MIISLDVGLKNGVKKKLNIFEGDNPEELSEKFAKEFSKIYILFIFKY